MEDPVRAIDVKSRKVQWLWRDRFALGTLAVVAGKPDQGKGLLAAHVAAHVSARGRKVIYSAMEDDESRMTRPRLEAAGAKLENVVLWRFQVPAMLPELEALIEEHRPQLVVLDPFNAHLSGGISRFSDSIRQVTTPLAKLAETYDLTVLITEHALKRVAQHAHPLQAIGGSGSGLAAAARMAYIFGVDPKDSGKRVLAYAKSNLRLPPKAISFEMDTEEIDNIGDIPTLMYAGEIECSASSLLHTASDGTGQRGRPADKRAAAAEWITNYLVNKGAPVKAGDLMEDAKQYKISKNTIYRAIEDLKLVRNPANGGKNSTVDLPPNLKALLGLAAPVAATTPAAPARKVNP